VQDELQQALDQFQQSVSTSQGAAALTMTGYLLLGGCMAIYLRFLYLKCSSSASDTDSITRTFPLLLMVTTAVISVVKSSLALSLGLVGALSIVRFRAAIKEPEELVYLFLCIAVGLALGAEQPLLAVALVASATVFVVGMSFGGGKTRDASLMLTIRGDADRFDDSPTGVLAIVGEVAGSYSMHRFDLDQGQGQLRVSLQRMKPADTGAVISKLRQRLPQCEFSYVNLNSGI
jgi:hypothetical protein